MDNRFLNMGYATEVILGRLNGSSDQVEQKLNGFNNVTYVKKIGNRGYISSVCQKYNIKRYMKFEGYELSNRIKNGSKISISALPHKFADEDVFGFMRADKEEITKEQYELLTEEEKKTFKLSGKKATRNTTKKRKSRFLMSPLVNVSNQKINNKNEWNVASSTDGSDSLPYTTQTYSGIFAGISNININDVSTFNISSVESEFRDYAINELENDINELSKEEKYDRIKSAIKGLQHLSIEGNQNNYLTDTTPKFVILAEYKWGNNVFQGIIKENGVDLDALEETLMDNEDFRLSNLWIGVSKRIQNKAYENLREKLQRKFENYDYVNIGTVKEAFDGYLKFLKETL